MYCNKVVFTITYVVTTHCDCKVISTTRLYSRERLKDRLCWLRHYFLIFLQTFKFFLSPFLPPSLRLYTNTDIWHPLILLQWFARHYTHHYFCFCTMNIYIQYKMTLLLYFVSKMYINFYTQAKWKKNKIKIKTKACIHSKGEPRAIQQTRRPISVEVKVGWYLL